MKTTLMIMLTATPMVWAQDKGMPPYRPVPPVVAAIDADQDHVLSAEEIANAGEALATLDQNGDGTLTMEEVRPPRPEGEEEEKREGRRPRRDRMPVPPVMLALDVNEDGQISSDEMEAAENSLLLLDADGDGSLIPDELRPALDSEGMNGPRGHHPRGPRGPRR